MYGDADGSAFELASIRATLVSSAAAPNNQGSLKFFTTPNGNAREQMHITEYGNVGIGTTAPSATLHVTGTFKSASADISNTLTAATVDLNSGNIDGTTIGSASAAQGTFTTLTATSLEISNILTASNFHLTATSATIVNTLTVQNLVITGDQSTTNTNIDGGSIDGTAYWSGITFCRKIYRTNWFISASDRLAYCNFNKF